MTLDLARKEPEEEAVVVGVAKRCRARDSSRGDVVDALRRELFARSPHSATLAPGSRTATSGSRDGGENCHAFVTPAEPRSVNPRDSPWWFELESAGETFDEAVDAARLRDVVDLERPGHEGAVAEQSPRHALLELEILHRPQPHG